MKKPVLVIMAAGMGSRYGGLKQIDPVDKEGHIIMDFSLFDAKRAGFEKVIFIIKKENEDSFREAVGNRMASAALMRSTGHLLLSMQMIIMEDMRLKQFIIICLSMRMMISIVMRWSDIF